MVREEFWLSFPDFEPVMGWIVKNMPSAKIEATREVCNSLGEYYVVIECTVEDSNKLVMFQYECGIKREQAKPLTFKEKVLNFFGL